MNKRGTLQNRAFHPHPNPLPRTGEGVTQRSPPYRGTGQAVRGNEHGPAKAIRMVVGVHRRGRWERGVGFGISAFAGITMALRRPHKGMKTGWCRERATLVVARSTTGLPEPIFRGMTDVKVCRSVSYR